MTALNLILIVAGAMLGVGLLTVLAWLIYSWYLDRVEKRLATRKGLYRELVSNLAVRDRALLHPTIHQISTLYDLDALEAVLEEQARNASGRPGWLLDVYDELGLVDKYIDMLRSARKWRERAFAAELLGRVGGAKAVPALLETVVATRTEDSDVREVALRALARIADPKAVAPLIQALETAEGWLAPRIADILTRHGEAVVEPLITMLNDGNRRPARAWAANVLGEVRAQRAFPSLVRLLGDPEDEVRSKAATALGRLGDARAVGYLLEHLLTDPAPFVRARIAASLGQFGSPDVINRLVRALGDPAWWVRLRTVEALDQIGAVAEGPLLVALDDPDSEIRARAAVALERLGVPDHLVRMIDSGERVPEATETLVKFATTGAREFLAELAQHGSSQVRSAVVTAIYRAERRDLADELLRIASADPDGSVRAQAFTTLRSLKILEAVPAALASLSDMDHRVRAAAVGLIGHLGGADVVDLVRAQTRDPDPAVRAAAIRALGGFGAANTEGDVGRLLGDPMPEVREAAILATTEGRLRSLVPSLLDLLLDPEAVIRRNVVRAIGILGEPAVVPILLRAFPDAAPEVTEAIAVAVSRLDPEAVGGLVDALVDSPHIESKLALIDTLTRTRVGAVSVLQRLGRDPAPDIRAAVIEAVARRAHRNPTEAEAAVSLIDSGLQDSEEVVRARAIDACSRVDGEGRASALLASLEDDPSPLARERIALALGLLRLPGSEEALLAACRRAEPANVRAAAALAAGMFEDQSIVALVVEMPDAGAVREILRERLQRDPRFRLLAKRQSRARQLEIRALASGTDAEAQASLARGMRSMLDAGDRVRLIGSLRAFQGEESQAALLQTIRGDPMPEVRTAALAAIRDLLGSDELLSTGARALGDPSVLVRRAAVTLFSRVDPERAIPRLIQALQVDDDPAVLAAAASLAQKNFDLFARTAQAAPADTERAVLAIRIAHHIVHSDLGGLLRHFARSERPDLRAAVAELWRQRPEVADAASLETLTIDPETWIRRSVAGAVLAAERYDLLEAMTQDPDATVRREVALVLGRGAPVPRQGVATLERLASDADMSVRAAAYVAKLLQGMALPLPPELDSQVAAEAVRESANLPRLRQTARTSSSEDQRLAAALALALLQDDIAREVARTDPAPAIRHRIAGALELSIVSVPRTAS
jgi:HEAT repeat protein